VIAVVGAGLINRHEREFDKGLAPASAFRLYLVLGGFTLAVLIACLQQLPRWRRREPSIAMPLFGVGVAGAVGWLLVAFNAFAS
jgi:hypothetical protein